MRTTIERSLVKTTIHACSVKIENGTPVATAVDPIVVYGNYTEEQARKEIARVHGKHSSVVLAKIEAEEKHYEISVDDFVKHAKEVEKKSEQTVTEN